MSAILDRPRLEGREPDDVEQSREYSLAHRYLSFAMLAAQELFISQAAVSRQIRELGALLGEVPFERCHRGVHLTASGAKLHLADVRLIAVAAPALLKAGPAIERPGDILHHTLLHEENRDVWSRWFEAAGLVMPETARGPIYADGGLVMQAVLRGQDIARVDEIFAGEEIQAGRLLRFFDVAIPLGAYRLVARSFERLKPAASVFVGWIRSWIEGF